MSSVDRHIPLKASLYCFIPSDEMNCADSSAVHSVMIVFGRRWSSPELPNVGVCSFERGSESVGECSESVLGNIGEATTLLSYSSSASESA